MNNKLLVLVVTSLILCSLFLSIVFVHYAKDKEAISFSFNYLKDLSLREANIAITLFILKEEIYTSSILLDSAVHQDKAGTKHESYLLHYISEISSIEREIVEKRKDLKEFSLELKNDLFDMHSPNILLIYNFFLSGLKYFNFCFLNIEFKIYIHICKLCHFTFYGLSEVIKLRFS